MSGVIKVTTIGHLPDNATDGDTVIVNNYYHDTMGGGGTFYHVQRISVIHVQRVLHN